MGGGAAVLALLAALPMAAQSAPLGEVPGAVPAPAFPLGRATDGAVQSPVLTIDQGRMFSDSAYGKRVSAEVDDAQKRLLAQNHRIEARLSAEEKDLTAKRPNMDPADFRKLADAFDAKVQKIRHDQNAKNQAISDYRDAEQKRFFQAALPILGQLVHDSGAVAILDQQAIVLSLGAIDITDRAIARLDATLGKGGEDGDAKNGGGPTLDSIIGPVEGDTGAAQGAAQQAAPGTAAGDSADGAANPAVSVTGGDAAGGLGEGSGAADAPSGGLVAPDAPASQAGGGN